MPVLLEDETGGDITGWVNAKCLEEAPDIKPEPPEEGPEADFPIFQKNLRRMFGTPSYSVGFRQKNIINIDLSEFADSLSHVKTLDGKKLTSTVGHRLLEKPLHQALGLVCDRGLAKEIKTFDGVWAVRPMKSSNSFSVHSWGLAIDFNAQTSPFQTPASSTWPDMVTDFSDDLVRCFAEAGFEWGGLWNSVYDPMHFQLPWTQDWRNSSDPLRPGVYQGEAPGPVKPEPAVPTPPGQFDFKTREGTIAAIRAECQKQGLTLPHQMAYVLATTDWETAHTFQPVREAFWLSEDWRRNNLRYYPYYGRGYVQLTWESNYSKYAKILNIDLTGNPDLAMDPQTALFILVHGFKTGAFTGKKLTDYINAEGVDFINARRCINRLDKAEKIAAIAEQFLEV
jgi:predicted chitinase